MKYLSIFIILFYIFGCKSAVPQDDKLHVTVTILPLKYLVDSISGGDFDVNVIVPPGASPETYEPTPSQMKDLSNSMAYFQVGLIDFERPLAEGVKNSVQSLDIIDLSTGVDVMTGDCGHIHNHSGAETGVDPHIWLSPRRIKIMAQMVGDKLAALNPDSASKYSANLLRLMSSIDSVDLYISQSFSAIPNKSFLIYHPSLSYYAADYGLNQLSVEHDGKDPSAEYLKSLIDNVLKQKINTVFYQKQLNISTVEALARETGLKMEVIDPLEYDLMGNLLIITDLIKKSVE